MYLCDLWEAGWQAGSEASERMSCLWLAIVSLSVTPRGDSWLVMGRQWGRQTNNPSVTRHWLAIVSFAWWVVALCDLTVWLNDFDLVNDCVANERSVGGVSECLDWRVAFDKSYNGASHIVKLLILREWNNRHTHVVFSGQFVPFISQRLIRLDLYFFQIDWLIIEWFTLFSFYKNQSILTWGWLFLIFHHFTASFCSYLEVLVLNFRCICIWFCRYLIVLIETCTCTFLHVTCTYMYMYIELFTVCCRYMYFLIFLFFPTFFKIFSLSLFLNCS